MLLYHGTDAACLAKIEQEGIKPRGRRKGNWSHTVRACPQAVYLTDTYPCYFAGQHRIGAVFEVETDELSPFRLNADEDVLAQALKGKDGVPEDLFEATRYFRRRLPTNQYNYEASLKAMGTCSYIGTIPPEAIKRVAVIDWPKQKSLLWRARDAQISLMNYRFCADDYQCMTRWLFGDEQWEIPPIPTGADLNTQMEWRIKYGKMAFVREGREGITVKDYSKVQAEAI
jgi:hypothetical protein